MTIMSQREQIELGSKLESDCAAIADLTCGLFEKCDGIKFMRDPTRGGLAATLNEITAATGLSIEISEADIPVRPAVQAAADVLGLDVLTTANEGKFVAVVSTQGLDKCLGMCRAHPLGRDAALIGEVTQSKDAAVVQIRTKIGGKRIVQMPYGRDLPRIC
jgi:hydrogenase expression/formation protein HypE